MAEPGARLASALLIDDDVALLDAWKGVAKTRNFELVVAESWERALELFHVYCPDLVIADYNLPGSAHGLRLLAEIRALRPTVRLILISGVVEESQLEVVEAMGIVDRAFSKGNSAAALQGVVDEIEAARSAETEPTDWAGFAEAHVMAASVDEETLRTLDDLLAGSAAQNRP